MGRILLVTVMCAFIAAPAMADFYTVDLGDGTNIAGVGKDVLSDPGITLSEWGQWEVSGSGGYGGIGPYNSRMVLGDSGSGDTTGYAEIYFPKPINWVNIRHLDGIKDDAFTVAVDGTDWGSYPETISSPETWLWTDFSGDAGQTLRITVDNPNTAWAATWGQLGIDKVEAVPVPGAVLLGILGLSAVGVKLRKFA